MPSKNENIDHDTRWKEMIEQLFEDFVAFFLPKLYEEIDFSHRPEFLKEELYQIISISHQKGTQRTDSLVKLYLKNGAEQWVLIHIEVQQKHETNFAQRMFQYYYRIMDKFGIEQISSIAIFIGEHLPKHYNEYFNSYFNTEVRFRYNTYVVRQQDEAKLWEHKNPFAIAVLAALHLIKTHRDSDDRLQKKIKLTDFVVKHGKAGNFSQKVIVELIRFVVNLMRLDEKREAKFEDRFFKLHQKSNKMQATIYDKRIADLFCLAYYGASFTDVEEAKERAQKEKERLQKEKERAQKEKEQEQKKALKLQSKLSNTILNLYNHYNMNANLIASIIGLEVEFVEKVIKKYSSKE